MYDKDKGILKKFNIVNFFIGVVFFILICKLWQLQIIHGDEYSAKAINNKTSTISISAPRGNIYDRNGVLLANNRMAYTISIVVEDVRSAGITVEDTAKKLSPVINMPVEEILAKVDEHLKGRYIAAYEPVRLVEDAPLDMITKVEERKVEMPGVTVEQEPYRSYPKGSISGSVVGYVGKISQEEYETYNTSGRYKATDKLGKSGIERAYEQYLKGTDGKVIVEVDSRAIPVGVVGKEEPIIGSTLNLTIDSVVQQAGEEALKAQTEALKKAGKFKTAEAGAAVMIDVNTGEILALCTFPTYDPNMFVPFINSKDWKALTEPVSALFNRAIAAAYPPGSTFKMFTVATVLEDKVVDLNEKFTCVSPSARYFNKRCWIWNNHSSHGKQNLFEGVVHSCNIVFYEMGRRLDVDHLANMAKEFGLGGATGLIMNPKESSGSVPTSKEKNFMPGEKLDYAIGQQVTVTPLQMAVAYAGIATKGQMYVPYLVKEILSPLGETTYVTEPMKSNYAQLSDSTWKFMHESMRAVVTGGTAANAFRGFPIAVAGKTGTAQAPPGDDHGWFAGFAPYENPQIAVAVVIERGGGGSSAAAPVARAMMEAYFKVGKYAENSTE